MANKVSLNSSSVGRPRVEALARDQSAARKRKLPTPGNTRLRGDGESRPQGAGNTRKASKVSVQRDRPLSKRGVKESLQRLRSEVERRPARALRVASSGLNPDSPGVRRVLRETGGSLHHPTGP
jgi:hypothetical protein